MSMTDPSDRPSAGHTLKVGLSVASTDLPVRQRVVQILQEFARDELAAFLQSADPLAAVSVDAEQLRVIGSQAERLGISVTSSDDDTADQVLLLLEDFARGPFRDALDHPNPDSLRIRIDATDGTVIWC